MIANLGLANHVALLTDIPYSEVPALIRRADVFVLCSRWEKGKFGEGFPLALAEAERLASESPGKEAVTAAKAKKEEPPEQMSLF